MKTQRLIGIITTVIIICLLSTCDAFSTKGRWNPLDPEYEAATDPDAPSSEYVDEFRWDFTTSTDGWGYGHSMGVDGDSQEVPEYLAGRVTLNQQNFSGADAVAININTDSMTGHVTVFSIKYQPSGSITPDPYFSTRMWVSQEMIDTGSTFPMLWIWGGKEDSYWEANNIMLTPVSPITGTGWYNYKIKITEGTYEKLGTPTFIDLSFISLNFQTTANPVTGDFCYIDYMRLATTADPDM